MYTEDLRFNNEGTFKILVFTDIHEKPDIDSPKGKAKSYDTFHFINTVLDEVKPDLVVLGGDNCTDFDSRENIDGFYPIFKRVTEPMIKRKIPFTTVLGNHEHDIDDRFMESIINEYEKCDYCLIKNRATDVSGNLNFYFTVKDEADDRLVLWFMDSNNTVKHPDGHIIYDCVHKDQIEWYKKSAEELKEKNGKTIPAILFQHIPVPEIYNLLRPAKWYEKWSRVEGHDHLKKFYYMKKAGCSGYLAEGPDIPFFNEGEFEAWKKVGDVKAAFFGHDHMNDFHGEYDGIIMGQSKTGGFRAYTDGCRCGCRLITINKNNPEKIQTKMYHFKDFGLKSTSLGPIEKRITDRQSTNLHKLLPYFAALLLGASGIIGYNILK